MTLTGNPQPSTLYPTPLTLCPEPLDPKAPVEVPEHLDPHRPAPKSHNPQEAVSHSLYPRFNAELEPFPQK